MVTPDDKHTYESQLPFSGVRRCVRAFVSGSNSTRPGQDQPYFFRRSNRPASELFSVAQARLAGFWSHKRTWLLSERSRAPPPTHNRFSRAANSRIYEYRACACVHTRCSTSVRPSPARSFPAFHFAFRVVWCRGQSHGWGGSRIAVSSRARDSSATPWARRRDRRCRQCWRCYHRLRDVHCALLVARVI